jgi:hypothetical protein
MPEDGVLLSGDGTARGKAARTIGQADAERRRRKARDEFVRAREPGREVGTDLAIERGAVEVVPDALIAEDPQDRHSATRRGARAQRVWAPDRLIRGKSPVLEQHQHDAATRFFDDYAIGELGANRGGRGGPRLDPWQRIPFDEVQVMRRESYRAAMKTLGPLQFFQLSWCVLQETPSPDVPPTVEKWAQQMGWRTERATGFFAATLESLARHYGFSRAGRGRDFAAG